MAVKEWTTVYPIGIDGLSEMPTLINDEDDALVSQAVSLRDIVIQLEEYVGTETPSSGTLRGRVANLETISGTVTAHASTHMDGGSDSIRLDELAAPTDNTALDASTSTHGLLPKLSNVSTEYMNGVGAWSTPAGGEGDASPLTTKGDLYGYTDSGTRIPVGTDGYVLTADSSEELGVKWAVAAGGTTSSGSVQEQILSTQRQITATSAEPIPTEPMTITFDADEGEVVLLGYFALCLWGSGTTCHAQMRLDGALVGPPNSTVIYAGSIEVAMVESQPYTMTAGGTHTLDLYCWTYPGGGQYFYLQPTSKLWAMQSLGEGSSSTVPIQDEGVEIVAAPTAINFIGDGVSVTASGTIANVTIDGSESPLTTKGDLYGYTDSGTRIPVGTDGYILTADSSEELGVKWAEATGGTTSSGIIVTEKSDATDIAGSGLTPTEISELTSSITTVAYEKVLLSFVGNAYSTAGTHTMAVYYQLDSDGWVCVANEANSQNYSINFSWSMPITVLEEGTHTVKLGIANLNNAGWVLKGTSVPSTFCISQFRGGNTPIQKDGDTIITAPAAINFIGDGVSVTASGTIANVTISGSVLNEDEYATTGLEDPLDPVTFGPLTNIPIGSGELNTPTGYDLAVFKSGIRLKYAGSPSTSLHYFYDSINNEIDILASGDAEDYSVVFRS